MPARLVAALLVVWLAGCGGQNPDAKSADRSAASDRERPDWYPDYVAGKRALRGGRLDEAARALGRALARLEHGPTPDERAQEEIHYALGETNAARFELGAARRHFEAAYEIDQRRLGANAPHTLEVLEALAIVIDYARDYPEAERRFRDLLGRVEKLRGKDSVEVARLEVNLAVNLSFQKRDDEAEPLLRKSIPVLEAKHEDDGLAHALNGLGTLLYRRSDFTPAREALERALAVRERSSGPDHPHVATILFNLCGIALDEGKLGQAEKSCGRALAIRKKALPESHPFRREIDERYAEVERRLGKK